jgi:hypothetical protein
VLVDHGPQFTHGHLRLQLRAIHAAHQGGYVGIEGSIHFHQHGIDYLPELQGDLLAQFVQARARAIDLSAVHLTFLGVFIAQPVATSNSAASSGPEG